MTHYIKKNDDTKRANTSRRKDTRRSSRVVMQAIAAAFSPFHDCLTLLTWFLGVCVNVTDIIVMSR